MHDSCVVEENVQGSEIFLRRLHHCLAVRRLADIGGLKDDVVESALLDQINRLLTTLHVLVDNDQTLGALWEERRKSKRERRRSKDRMGQDAGGVRQTSERVSAAPFHPQHVFVSHLLSEEKSGLASNSSASSRHHRHLALHAPRSLRLRGEGAHEESGREARRHDGRARGAQESGEERHGWKVDGRVIWRNDCCDCAPVGESSEQRAAKGKQQAKQAPSCCGRSLPPTRLDSTPNSDDDDWRDI